MSSATLHPVESARPLPKWLWFACGAGLIWAYWPTLDFMVAKWISDPQYSHGFLVPIFSGYLIYRKCLPGTVWFSRPWPIVAGVALILMLALRALAGGLLFHQLDALALLGSMAALTLAFGGIRLFKMTGPAVLFLLFMVPLPYELEQNVGGPLKIVATTASTFLLQTLGYPAIAEGNIILIDEVRLGVVDACSGLKMLMTFSAFAFAAVLLLDRTWFEKFLIVLGIVPIAVLANVLRIVATAVVCTITPDKATQLNAHDIFGWLMMPLGLGLLALQLWCLSRLVVRPGSTEPAREPLGFGLGARPVIA